MKKNHSDSSLPPEADELRHIAEAQLQEQPAPTDPLPVADALRLLHELHVHQIDLELQNEELREACTRLEQSLKSCVEHHETTASLWERERQFSTLLQTVPAGVGIIRQRVFQQANDCFHHMLGYAPAELIGQSARRLYANDAEFERVGRENYCQIERTGFGAIETRWCRKDGRLIDVFLRSAAIVPHQSELGILFAALDISARKRMETALRSSERRYRSLVELLPYGVQENDCDGCITFANPALERLHGWRKDGLVGRLIWDFAADAAERERLRHDLQFLVREQPPPKTYFSKNRRADGTVIDIQVDWNYRRDEHGQLQGFIAVITDVTEQQRTQLRLVEHTTRLQQLSRRLFSVQEEERRRLARELHDDLGQQLAALKLNLATLNHRLSATEHQRYIADSLEIVNHTLERLRDVARDLRPSVLDDLGLAAALHGYARRQAERASCKIEVWDRLPPLSPEVETAVFRIVQEAINNATRHGMAQNITVNVEVCDRVLSLTIRDNGGGFDPALVSANSPPGLGLSSMRERAELLDGRFDLASQPGQGVVITVTIPVAEAMP